MCGVIAYIGKNNAYPIVLDGLKRLEYRGYDSAGIFLYRNKQDFSLLKSKGQITNLEKLFNHVDKNGSLAIGHTRWATHGVPNDLNSHPHTSNSGRFVIIHNGIIENYESLKKELVKYGYVFTSETDTEVLVNFIEHITKLNNVDLPTAIQQALQKTVGAYAIVVFDKDNDNQMVVAKQGSPLVIGVGDHEMFIASDASPFIQYTKKAIYLNDGELAVITRDSVNIRTIDKNITVNTRIKELSLNLEQIEKNGFDHFMLKEIYEQPKAIVDTYRGRLPYLDSGSHIIISGLNENLQSFKNAKRIIIVACGTSWHAGLVAEYIFEDFCRIPVEVEYASEFRYRNPIIRKGDIVIAISQSGETADTLAALKLAKQKEAFIFSICNVVGSSIARESHAGMYTHAGPEIGVASTKAFTTQITSLLLMALKIAGEKGTLSEIEIKAYIAELKKIPEKIESILGFEEKIINIARKYFVYSNALYLGRGYNFPVALEGALKLKEISYIHAEGYPAAEMKHGPIALIDKDMPVVVIAPHGDFYEKIVSNTQEIKARQAKVISIVTKGDTSISKLSDDIIEIPEVSDALSPLLTTIPLQLLSYHIALLRGCNVDKPRNLAKSVTVE